MTALRAHRRGGPEVLVLESAPIPVPAAGEVLIEVHSAAITFDELTWDETWLRDGRDRTPVIPSHEVSGVVAATASDVTEFSVGEQVYGLIRFDRDGAAAEFVTVPAADLAGRPATVGHVNAAALPLAGLTAWQALVVHAGVRAGQRVLIHGGAGGVGALASQLARVLGAEVTATVRSDEAYGVDTVFFIVEPDREQLRRLAEYVDTAQLTVPIAATFRLADGRAAFESGRRPGRRPGKTVLVVRD
jgi:NADPH:quinone reductase-like Zn-dependent oxidoreductase